MSERVFGLKTWRVKRCFGKTPQFSRSCAPFELRTFSGIYWNSAFWFVILTTPTCSKTHAPIKCLLTFSSRREKSPFKNLVVLSWVSMSHWTCLNHGTKTTHASLKEYLCFRLRHEEKKDVSEKHILVFKVMCRPLWNVDLKTKSIEILPFDLRSLC